MALLQTSYASNIRPAAAAEQSPAPTPENAVLEGAISILAALRSGSREIQTIFARTGRGDTAISRIEELAKQRGIAFQRVAPEQIDELASGTSHGGIAAIAGPRRIVSMDELMPAAGVPWIAMIDGIEDPYNFGAAVRGLYAAGADGLVLRPRNWMSAAGVVARSSAGATELIPTAIAETALDAAAHLRGLGLAVACATDDRKASSLYEINLAIPLFLLIGGEKRGITRSFLDNADLLIRIPYGRPVPYALGTAGATAVLSFEIMRQRREASQRIEPLPRPLLG